MNKKVTELIVDFVMFMLIASLFQLVFCKAESNIEVLTSPGLNPADSFTPMVWKSSYADQNNNAIADSLDREIADRIANGTAQDWVSVTVVLKSAPTTQVVDEFISSGGRLTTDLWTKAAYGFGGAIKYGGIAVFVQRCPDVLLVEKEAVGEACVAYAAQQVGARSYVWSTLGLQGDPNASTAIIDSGIDGSHIDFSPGYGDLDFSKKIVGWNDQVGSTTVPVDDYGHGSHCAGLAGGNGFFSVDASGCAKATWSADLTGTPTGYYSTGMMVNNTGNITVSIKWVSTGTVNISTLYLMYSGKSLETWSQLGSISTPSNNTWYTLVYNVSSPPLGGYDIYNPRVKATSGTGDLYVALNVSWPYTPPADGFSAWTGIAPQSKLVGVRVLSSQTAA